MKRVAFSIHRRFQAVGALPMSLPAPAPQERRPTAYDSVGRRSCGAIPRDPLRIVPLFMSVHIAGALPCRPIHANYFSLYFAVFCIIPTNVWYSCPHDALMRHRCRSGRSARPGRSRAYSRQIIPNHTKSYQIALNMAGFFIFSRLQSNLDPALIQPNPT
jgi:hypothetical protein